MLEGEHKEPVKNEGELDEPTKKEIQIYQKLLNQLRPEERRGDVGKFIIEKFSSIEVAYLSYKAERKSWIEKLLKIKKARGKEKFSEGREI